MPVTIQDVARAAGVSVSTVSRAFTVPDLVKDETRQHVLQTAERLGYRPNRAARGLITGKTGNFGVIVPDLSNPFFPTVLKGVQARAREADYAVFLADCDENATEEIALVQAMAKQVDGVILCSSRMSPNQLERVVGTTSLVFINRQVRDHPTVLMGAAGGMRQAIDHLAALGHRRVAFLNGPKASWSNRERRRGLRQSARYDMEIVELGPFAPRFEGGPHAADLAIAEGVTAIIAFNDLLALGVMSRLADRGIAVPDEMSVVGFDDIPMAGMATPPLTTVAMQNERAGRAAVDLLVNLLTVSGAEAGDLRRELDCQLIVRASTSVPARS
ncbi:LacI family transcriptional regulator [Actinoallomurus purpureus]|uniref:LacI family DNA-binding transcriptional regulator n=1 Tax=Actinoallomurus purpureus TaxID=478114 RepID=UPI0020924F9E|nr:LacI family DNA-binding transcriptional regulator [Actinoallomurus purpureus]MCO6009428.1 LacI family transcriptional regulator [Actinoallomurus purpureus]